CVRYERPTTWALVGESPRLKASFGGRVRPTRDGAHLVMRMEIELHGLLRLAAPLLRRRAQPLVQRDLANIKARLEGAASDTVEPVRGGSAMMGKQPLGAAVLDVLTALPLF